MGKDAHQVMLGEHGVVFHGDTIHGFAARDAPSVRPDVIVGSTCTGLILASMDDDHVIHDAVGVRVIWREVETRGIGQLHCFANQFVDADIAVVVHCAGALARVTVPPVIDLGLGTRVPLAIGDLTLNVQLRVGDLLNVVPHATGRASEDQSIGLILIIVGCMHALGAFTRWGVRKLHKDDHRVRGARELGWLRVVAV